MLLLKHAKSELLRGKLFFNLFRFSLWVWNRSTMQHFGGFSMTLNYRWLWLSSVRNRRLKQSSSGSDAFTGQMILQVPWQDNTTGGWTVGLCTLAERVETRSTFILVQNDPVDLVERNYSSSYTNREHRFFTWSKKNTALCCKKPVWLLSKE